MVAANIEHRELTLMFTDIVGYSRLMGRDETLTIEMLGDYRHILLHHIEDQGGVLIEFVGDAIFSRFDTPQAAVAAAVDIQKHLMLYNQGRDKNLPRLQTRIGIHTGEVVVRENAVFGDNVNIAARLEPLAVADGICISRTVYDAIRLNLREPIKCLGFQSLKNIEQKICTYLIKPSGIGWGDQFYYFWQSCCKKTTAYRYPISAAILALFIAGFYFIPRWLVPGYTANYVEIADFQNLMNTEGESDYFSAGITEAVRSQLADMRDVYIVEADKGINAPIRLEGSVQKIGDNLRIVYRLFRRESNVQIAGGKLDGAYRDIFILQDRLVAEIARYLADEFQLQNFRPAPLKLTTDITAYDFYLRGIELLDRPSAHENFDKAIQLFTEALIHDENFSLASAGLCEAYWHKYQLTNTSRWLSHAENYCLSAISLEGNSVRAYKAIGAIYRDFGKYNKAIEYLEKGRLIDRHSVSLTVTLASVYNAMSDKTKAEELYKEALLLAPKNWEAYSGYGYFLTINGRYDEAIENYETALQFMPENGFALNNIGINYYFKNQFKDAAIAFEKATRIEPASATFANTGTMYYSAGDFAKAAEMFEQALRLQPENYQWMVFLADAYKYIRGGKKAANEFFNEAIRLARKEIALSPDIAKSYQYLARSLAYFGDLEEANSMLSIADVMDPNSADAYYAHLRVAVLEQDDEKIIKYAQHLLETQYSDKLLLADPDLSVLKEERFNHLFDPQQ